MKLKILLLSCLAMVATFAAFGQNNSGLDYTATLLQLPTSTLPPAPPGASGTLTNFYSGFLGVTGYQTNLVTPVYNPAIPGFTALSTNIVTNTAMMFPQIHLPTASVFVLEYRGTASAATGTNVVFTFANSLTARNGMASTANQFTWTVPLNQGAGVPTIAMTTITNTFGSIYLISELWQGTNGAVTGTLTNLDGGLWFAAEPQTIQPSMP